MEEKMEEEERRGAKEERMAEKKNYFNENYKNDIDYVVKIARTLLTPIGIYPLYGNDSFMARIMARCQTLVVFGLMCFLLAPHFIYTFFDAEDLSRLMKVIAAQIFSLLAIIKFWTMIINKNDLRYCLDELENHWREVTCEEDRTVMTESAKIGRLCTIAYLGLSYGGALPYHIVLPLVADRIVKDDNTTQIPLPYPSDYVFFVPEDSPGYEMLFVSQILISSIILSTNCGVYSLIAIYVMHACCLFQVVQRQLRAIFDYSKTLEELTLRLAVIVENHSAAIRYAQRIEKALNVVFLSEMVGCTVIICFLEFGVLKDWEDKKMIGVMTYAVLMTSIFVNVFIFSFTGDRLKEQSEKVGECSYCIEWYDLPKDLANDLMFIMVRASRPSNLTAGKVFDLSLQGFCEVVKTSAAYLNFLRAMVT
ncbi:odorant receptor 49b-like [Venturia canescens]|uniref:odorant receptor 49b-like n=1 Tax=Venturia canescens TaxID=32260 RepID=UPI001C9C4D8D|nr:odorant receptor 49b-like [Venturia canescens]